MAGQTACSEFIPRLSPLIDGELSPSERSAVEQHVTGCALCTGRVADLRAESGLIRVGLEMAADDVDFVAFTQSVMAKLTPVKLSLVDRWRVGLSEMFAYQRGPLMAGMVAVAVALFIAVPLLMTGRTPEGYASEQMSVQTVSTDQNAHVAPVVMQADNGDAIIWLVNHDDHDAQLKAPQVNAESEEEGVRIPSHAPDASQPLNQERPKGGEL
jgi:anti-sigma factor RsiW